MHRSNVARPAWLGAIALAILFGAAPSHAEVIINQCGDVSSDFGTDCSLQELLDGGSIDINGVEFANFVWTEQMDSVGPLTDIRVDPVDSRSRPALVFTDNGTTWNHTGLFVSINTLQFQISSISSPFDILGRRMYANFGDISVFNLGNQEDSNVFIKDRAFRPTVPDPQFEAVVQCFASEVDTLGKACDNTTRRDSHTGAQQSSLWLQSNDVIAKMDFNIIAEATGHAQLKRFIYQLEMNQHVLGAIVPDLNLNGVPEIAVLDQVGVFEIENAARVQVKDALGGPALSNRTFLVNDPTTASAHFVPSMVSLPDLDGNGVPELAVLGWHPAFGAVIEIQNASGPALKRTIVLPEGYFTTAMKVMNGDFDHNGITDLAVLLDRDSDHLKMIQVFNAYGTLNRQSLLYPPGSLNPVDFTSIDDGNGDGAPEIAALCQRVSDGLYLIETRNVGGPTVKSTKLFATGYAGRFIATVADGNGNAMPDLAVLLIESATGKKYVHVLDEFGLPNKRVFSYPGGSAVRPLMLLGIPDTDGDGSPEIALLVDQRRTADTTVYVDDTSGLSVRRIVDFTRGTRPAAIGFALVGDLDLNGSQEFSLLTSVNVDGKLTVETRNIDGPPGTRFLVFKP